MPTMKENNSGSFSSNPNLRILLICASTALISGAGGYLLGSSSFDKLVFSQKVAATTVNTPSANKISQTTSSPTTAESPSQSSSTAANNKIQALEERLKNNEEQLKNTREELKNTKDYSKSISDTVFPTILSTVVTILVAFLTIQWFSNIWNHEREKEDIKRKLQYWLENDKLGEVQNKIDDNLQLILCNQIEKIFSGIEIKTKWLEYQIAILAAEQMEMQQFQTSNLSSDYQKIQQDSRQPILLQQRIQAIRALQYLESNHQGFEIKYCLEEELAAVKHFFEKITLENLKKTPILNEQIQELNKLFNVDDFGISYGKEVYEINQIITRLKSKTV